MEDEQWLRRRVKSENEDRKKSRIIDMLELRSSKEQGDEMIAAVHADCPIFPQCSSG